MKITRIRMTALAALAALTTAFAVVMSEPSAAADQAATLPVSAQDHAAEAARYDQEALDLEAKAKSHKELAAGYRARVSGGGKLGSTLQSLSRHCERLANAYQEAADEAREMAKGHRDMAGAG